MITERQLNEAIQECHGIRKPNANICMMLASYYTIKDHMYPNEEPKGYSFDMDGGSSYVDYTSETEFGKAVNGKDIYNVMKIMDDLMGVLQLLNPALYGGVLRQLES